MFEFSPPEAEHQINLANNRVIVCYGSASALLPLMDWFVSKGCDVRVRSIPDQATVTSLASNVRTAQGNVVLFFTDPRFGLPLSVMHMADMVLFGDLVNTDSIVVEKDRGNGERGRAFTYRRTSSPTGRTVDPMAGPRLQNMKPDRTYFDPKDTSWRGYSHNRVDQRDQALADAVMSGRSGYSMGATVKKPDDCPMCEAGIPAYKQGEKPPTPDVEFKSHDCHAILTHTSDGEMKLHDGKGREFIKVNAEGEAFVRGEKVAASQQDVYEMFRAWVLKTVGSVPLPKPGVPDAQGDVFTKECVEQLRKQRLLATSFDQAKDIYDGLCSALTPEVLTKHVETLLSVEPIHGYSSCSDEKPVNPTRCTRCMLLQTRDNPSGTGSFVQALLGKKP